MGLRITGLNELREHLERLRPEDVMARALAEQAARAAARVRDGLGELPGGGGHDEPWLRSGALRDSIGAQAEGLQAVAGSSDPAAVPQELGTMHMPPRPFLAPAVAEMGEEVARAVGAAVAAALRGDNPGVGGADDQHTDAIQASATPMDAALAVLGALAVVGTGLALKGQPPSPGLHGPVPVPPLMNQSSSDGDGSSPTKEGAEPVKPVLKPNEAHNPRNQNYNPNKDPDPPGL